MDGLCAALGRLSGGGRGRQAAAGGEVAELVGAGWFSFLFLLAGFFLLQPLRDEMALRLGQDALPRLFFATTLLTATLGAAVSRSVFNLVDAFHALVIGCVVFFWLLHLTAGRDEVSRALFAGFYVSLSAVNLLLVAAIWSTLAEALTLADAVAHYGFVASGATLGQILGSTAAWAAALAAGDTLSLLLLAAAVFLGAATFVGRLESGGSGLRRQTLSGPDAPRGADAVGPVALVCGSRPWRLAAAHITCSSVVGSFFYFKKLAVVAAAQAGAPSAVASLASIQVANGVTIALLQVVATGRVLRGGLRRTLYVAPFVAAAAWALVAFAPSVGVVTCAELGRKVAQHVFNKPAREAVFTAPAFNRRTPGEKARTKLVVDTLGQRGGDTLAALALGGLGGSSGLASHAAFLAAAAAWAWASWELGGAGAGG